MMIHAVCGLTLGEIESRLPYAHGLHWQALWWLRENAARQLAAIFAPIPVIRLLRPGVAEPSPAARVL